MIVKKIPPILTPIQRAEIKDRVKALYGLGFSKKIIAKKVFTVNKYIKTMSLLLQKLSAKILGEDARKIILSKANFHELNFFKASK